MASLAEVNVAFLLMIDYRVRHKLIVTLNAVLANHAVVIVLA